MSTLIGIAIGAVAGIVFSFAFPEPAMTVNNAVTPYIQTGLDAVSMFLKDALIGVLSN